jgi:adenylylsulfate kinase-like enzyme
MGAFKEPQGGELKDLYLDPTAAEAEKQTARDYASWDLTERQLCDIELIMNGAFSPLEVCEESHRKGHYAVARAGKIKEFTVISDPYETPDNAEMIIDTVEISPDLAAHRILVELESMGFTR